MGSTEVSETLWQDLHYALRQLRKSAGFALFSIATLAIGLGSATAAFSILDQWVIRPLALKNAGQLEHLWRTSAADHTQPLFFFQYNEHLKFVKQSRSFASLSPAFYRSYTLTGRGKPEEVMGEITTANHLRRSALMPRWDGRSRRTTVSKLRAGQAQAVAYRWAR